MTEKNHPIDQFFKKGIEKEYPFDENLWNELDKPLAQSRSTNFGRTFSEGFGTSRNILLILFSLTLLFLESGIQVNASQDAWDVNSSLAPVTETATANRSKNNPARVKLPVSKQAIISHKKNKEENTTDQASEKAGDEHQDAILANEQANFHTDHKKSDDVDQNGDITNKVVAAVEVEEGSNIAVSSNIFTKSLLENDPDKKIAKSTERETNNNIAKANENETIPFPNSVASTAISENKTFIDGSEKEVFAHTPALKSMPRLDNPPQLITNSNESNSIISPKDIDAAFNTNKKSIYLEFEVRRSIQLNKQFELEDKEYEKYKKEHEFPLHQYNMGINLMKDHRKFTYGVGLHFKKTKEVVKKQQNTFNYSYDTTYSMLDDSYDHNGKLIFIINREIHTDSTLSAQENINTYTEFSSLQLPLFVGYKFNLKNWDMELRSGIYLSYLMQSKGNYVGKDLSTPVPLNEKSMKNFQLSHQLQLRLSYALNEYLAIGTAIDYRYDLSSTMKDYENKFSSYGAVVFIRSRIFD